MSVHPDEDSCNNAQFLTIPDYFHRIAVIDLGNLIGRNLDTNTNSLSSLGEGEGEKTAVVSNRAQLNLN
jgi:hypothetical protein